MAQVGSRTARRREGCCLPVDPRALALTQHAALAAALGAPCPHASHSAHVPPASCGWAPNRPALPAPCAGTEGGVQGCHGRGARRRQGPQPSAGEQQAWAVSAGGAVRCGAPAQPPSLQAPAFGAASCSRPRQMATGQDRWCSRYPDTLPRPTSDSSVDLTAPRPREPTTARSAPCCLENATSDSATPGGAASEAGAQQERWRRWHQAWQRGGARRAPPGEAEPLPPGWQQASWIKASLVTDPRRRRPQAARVGACAELRAAPGAPCAPHPPAAACTAAPLPCAAAPLQVGQAQRT